MKKYTSYILILIMLIGVLIPIWGVSASVVNPNELCNDPVSPTNQPCKPAVTPTKGMCSIAIITDLAACQAAGGSWSTYYHLLSPLPCPSTDPNCTGGQLTDFNPGTQADNTTALGSYLNLMIKIFIGICAVLAVIMIIIGGIEYMTSELISNKEHGKERILGAVFGLLLALGSYTILNQINPNLLNADFKSMGIQQVEADINTDVPQTYDSVTKKYPNGATYGNPWDDTVAKIATLPAYVTVYNRQCTFIGDIGCTSTRGLDTSAVQAIQYGCKCVLQISGGTESWRHGGATGNTSHMVGSSTVDLLTTPQLDQYLSGGQPLINKHRYPPTNAMYETEGGNHWHIGP